MPRHALIFGGNGAIGSTIAEYFRSEKWDVTVVVRNGDSSESVCWQPLDDEDSSGKEKVMARGPYDAVCWAQGANCNDSAYDFDAEVSLNLYKANVLYVMKSLNALVQNAALRSPSRLCVISSIWQNLARQNKFSYCVTKAAVQGLVLSAANDLARDGHLINAVLPGVLDTPMTRSNLNSAQVQTVTCSTQFNRLPTLSDVASAVYLLCSEANTGITGQFINVDLGYSGVRII